MTPHWRSPSAWIDWRSRAAVRPMQIPMRNTRNHLSHSRRVYSLQRIHRTVRTQKPERSWSERGGGVEDPKVDGVFRRLKWKWETHLNTIYNTILYVHYGKSSFERLSVNTSPWPYATPLPSYLKTRLSKLYADVNLLSRTEFTLHLVSASRVLTTEYIFAICKELMFLAFKMSPRIIQNQSLLPPHFDSNLTS